MGPTTKIKRDCLGTVKERMVPVKPARCAQGGVACELKLFLDREDADLDTSFKLDCRISRQNEGCFTQVSLAREGLHLLSGETTRIGEDS